MTATPGHEELEPITHLSISTLVKAATCLRRLFYDKLGLRPQESSRAQDFGRAIHAALPTLPGRGLEGAMEVFDRVWGQDPPEGSEDWDRKRNRERAEAMLRDFADRHRPGVGIYELIQPPEELRPRDEDVSDWELQFSIDIGLPVPLEGRIDGIARHVYTGDLFALEYKTSGEVSSRFLNCLGHSPQAVGYPTVLRESGIDCAGTIGEVLRVSPNRVETASEPFYISSAQSQAFLEWARFWGSMVLACQEQGVWPRNFAGCSPLPGYGQAGWLCSYAPLCHSTDDWRKLRSEYEPVGGVELTIRETEVRR